jgi:AmmeMemoRadiSam system protein B/AmmeMemoRadiSam system protein A
MRNKGLLSFLLFSRLAFSQVHGVPSSASWFPAEPERLQAILDRAFSDAGKRAGGVPSRKGLLAVVAPHAALTYSGTVAASAYRLLDKTRGIVLLGFSHRRPIRGVVAPAVEAYTTPVGQVPVNGAALRELGFPLKPESELCDHSLENQLPFVARAAPGIQVIPLYVGQLSDEELAGAARKLAARLARGEVIVASSDLTHYGASYGYTPFPNDVHLPSRLRGRAIEIFERIGSLDVPAFDRFVLAKKENVCGSAPIRLLMATLARTGKEVYPATVDYMASGELSADYSLSVGYGALAFYPESAFSVGREAQAKLLESARQTLSEYLATGKKAPVPVPAADRNPDLAQRAGVFVTVKKEGRLRGCIGTLVPTRPLRSAVADRTLAAVSEDPRYEPLTAKEGPVSLEISVLTPLKRIQDWRQFRIGLGGLIVLNGKAGTILPQIAGEMRWNEHEFLENLSRKAGLDGMAYRDPRAQLYVYSAQVISEPGESGN